MEITLYTNMGGSQNKIGKNPTGGVVKTGIMKSAKDDENSSFSVKNPVMLISLTDEDMMNLTYAKIFDKYYFIDDIKAYDSKLKEVYMSIDLLHTYRTQIRQCNIIIGYESDYYEPYVQDSRIVTSTELQIETLTKNLGVDYSPIFVLGVNGVPLGESGGTDLKNVSGVAYYILNATQLYKIVKALYTSDVRDALTGFFGKTNEGLISLVYMPMGVGVNYPEQLVTNVVVGDYVLVDDDGNQILATRIGDVQEFTVQPIEIPAPFGNFIDHDPYTSITVNIACVGSVELDPKQFVGNNLIVKYSGRFYAGDGVAKIYSSRGGLVSTHPCQIATNLPLNIESSVDFLMGIGSMVAQPIATGLGALAGGGIGALAGNQIAQTITQPPSHKNSTGGGANSFESWENTVTVTIKRPKMVIDNSNYTNVGNPSGRSGIIGDFTGTIYPTSVDLSPLRQYSDEIKTLLMKGFIV